MRSSSVAAGDARRFPRRRLWIIVGAVALILLITSLRGIAVFYTDFLWFSAQGLTRVWSGVLGAKVGLATFFMLVFFLLCWGNLSIVDRSAPRSAGVGPEDELVSRYREAVLSRAWMVRTGVSAVLAVLVGAGASSEWNNWILFRNSVSFNKMQDPQFHHDISFYVFKLPFLSFLVSWSLAALAVVTVAAAVEYYLIGGIRIPGKGPHVAPYVKAHLSLLLGGIALIKAVGYVLARYQLLTATDGYAEGAFYDDVHVRLHAYTLLVYISLFALAILLVNIRRRGWVLPVLAIGLWAFISLVVGEIIPALVQRLGVQPSQISKELPYIARNISATRYALDVGRISSQSFAYAQNITASQVEHDARSLYDVRVWDPEIAGPTFNKLQDIRSYYSFNELSVNRLDMGSYTAPVLIGVRELNPSQLPANSWVNSHLQYTHGYGAVVAPADSTTLDGNPNFILGDVPPQSSSGAPQLTQPQVYYGLNEPGYVVANTKQKELDFQTSSGATVGSYYSGTGGVAAGSILRRAAFALRFDDLNVLLSGQITSQSRVMYIRNIDSMVQKVAPFLAVDSSPYPVILSGEIYWVLDAYTTTNRFPYSQQPSTSGLSSSSGLSGSSFNYIRNSVKILINAYNGQMTFYVVDQSDPIIRVYEKAFPVLFTPASKMPAQLRSQLRYPMDLFTIQANAYGRYHITDPEDFYNAGDSWEVSPDPGYGKPGNPSTSSAMPPQYVEMQPPGASSPGFYLVEPMTPTSAGQTQENLSSFLVVGCDPSDYGQITAYVTPRGQQVYGPAQVNSLINADTQVSSEISALDAHGSVVMEGTVMLVPVNQSLLYVRPLYVSSSQSTLPEMQEVIVFYGDKVIMAPTLAAALDKTFGSSLSSSSETSSPGQPPQGKGPSAASGQVAVKVAALIAQADSDLATAQDDLATSDLAGYQQEVNAAKALLDQAHQLTSQPANNGKGSA